MSDNNHKTPAAHKTEMSGYQKKAKIDRSSINPYGVVDIPAPRFAEELPPANDPWYNSDQLASVADIMALLKK